MKSTVTITLNSDDPYDLALWLKESGIIPGYFISELKEHGDVSFCTVINKPDEDVDEKSVMIEFRLGEKK